VLFPIPKPDPSEPPDVDERIWDLDVATSAVYTANYAMFRLLRQLKIQPDFMAGHSSGELTALHASGALLDQDDEQIMSLCLDLLATGRSMIVCQGLLGSPQRPQKRDFFKSLVVQWLR